MEMIENSLYWMQLEGSLTEVLLAILLVATITSLLEDRMR